MLEKFTGLPEMAAAVGDAIAALLNEAIASRGAASFVGTGGRSPGPIYDYLQTVDVDWARVSVTLSDERFVPPTAPESNIGLLDRRLFVGAPAKATFVSLWSDVPSAEDAAQAVEPALRDIMPFDAVLLGMGEDGHVASLLPRSPVLAESLDLDNRRLALSIPEGVGSPPVPRITLTLAALLQSRAIFISIAGESKRDVVARALAGEDLPVRAVLTQDRVPVRIFWTPSHE